MTQHFLTHFTHSNLPNPTATHKSLASHHGTAAPVMVQLPGTQFAQIKPPNLRAKMSTKKSHLHMVSDYRIFFCLHCYGPSEIKALQHFICVEHGLHVRLLMTKTNETDTCGIF